MSARCPRWWWSCWVAFGACQSAGPPAEQAMADSIRKLEARVAAMENPRRPEGSTGPAATRVASLRAAADFLELAEVARKNGEPGRAAAFYDKAAEEVGADTLADIE